MPPEEVVVRVFAADGTTLIQSHRVTKSAAVKGMSVMLDAEYQLRGGT